MGRVVLMPRNPDVAFSLAFSLAGVLSLTFSRFPCWRCRACVASQAMASEVASSSSVASRTCNAPGCSNPARQQCPTCLKNQIPQALASSFFCSQECFKAAWPAHKLLHALPLSALVRRAAGTWNGGRERADRLNPPPASVRRTTPQTTTKSTRRGRGTSSRDRCGRGRRRLGARCRRTFSGPTTPTRVRARVCACGRRGPRRGPAVADPRVRSCVAGHTAVPISEARERNQPPRVLTPEQIEKMRTVCRIGREVLNLGAAAIKVGVTTDEIDRVVHEATIARNAYPSPLNYNGFPKSCCTYG